MNQLELKNFDQKLIEDTGTNRTVAFFDILGFQGILQRFPLKTIGKTYQKAMDESINLIASEDRFYPHKNLCTRYIFSDSIIFITKDDSEISFSNLLRQVKRTMQVLILHQLFIRGGIAFGEMFIDVDRNIFLGNALTTACNLEKNNNG